MECKGIPFLLWVGRLWEGEFFNFQVVFELALDGFWVTAILCANLRPHFLDGVRGQNS
jgi:hypothetical protein